MATLPDEGTPQLATRRHPWSLQTRVQHKPTRAQHKAMGALVAGVGAVTPDMVIAKLDEHLGYQYGFWDRCGGSRHEHDCCLVGDTLIWTATGARPIAALAVGDRVWGYEDGERVLRRVTAVTPQPPRSVFKVRTTRRAVIATSNHPFLTIRRGVAGQRGKGQHLIEWQSLDDGLRPGDRVITMGDLPLDGDAAAFVFDGNSFELTPDLAWFAGQLLADGHVRPNEVRLADWGGHRERAKRIVADSFDGINTYENDTIGVSFQSRALARTVTAMGLAGTSSKRVIPDWVWISPRKHIEAFLEGFRDGDGHDQSSYRSYEAYSYASSSERLLREIRALHQMLGHGTSQARVTERKRPIVIRGKEVQNALPLWSCEIYPEPKRVGVQDLRWARPTLREPFGIERVIEVLELPEEETWDLTVEGSHSFVADGLVVHNSGYQCWMTNQLGIGLGCMSSFTMAQLCYAHGLIIGADEARATKAVWAFHGPNGGRGPSQRPNGSDGHIVCGDGTGQTREAMGRAYGVRIGPWDGRAWVAYSKIPGVDYAPPPPPPPPPEEEDVIIVLDSKKPLGPDGNKPYAQFIPANAFFPHGAVTCYWGASINQDLPTHTPNVRVWAPAPRAGHKWVSMAGRSNDRGVVLIDDGGHTTAENQGLWS